MKGPSRPGGMQGWDDARNADPARPDCDRGARRLGAPSPRSVAGDDDDREEDEREECGDPKESRVDPVGEEG